MHQTSLLPNHSAQTTEFFVIHQPWYLPILFTWVGILQYLSTSPPIIFQLGKHAPVSFKHSPLQYLSTSRGAGNLLHHHIKLKFNSQHGRCENHERLTKFIQILRMWTCTRGLCWYQGSNFSYSSGEEGNYTLSPFVVTIKLSAYKNAHHKCCKLSSIWGYMRIDAWETVLQIALTKKKCKAV